MWFIYVDEIRVWSRTESLSRNDLSNIYTITNVGVQSTELRGPTWTCSALHKRDLDVYSTKHNTYLDVFDTKQMEDLDVSGIKHGTVIYVFGIKHDT